MSDWFVGFELVAHDTRFVCDLLDDDALDGVFAGVADVDPGRFRVVFGGTGAAEQVVRWATATLWTVLENAELDATIVRAVLDEKIDVTADVAELDRVRNVLRTCSALPDAAI